MKLETLAMLGNDPLKLNNAINTCLMNPNIILYYAFSLNIYEYLKYHQHQYYHLKNIIRDSVVICNEIIGVPRTIPTKAVPAKTISTHFNGKK